MTNHNFKSIGWTIFGYVFRLGIQGIYFILLARTLGISEFGKFSAILALVNILAPFAGLGAGNVMVLQISRNQSLYKTYFGKSLAIYGFTFVFLSFVAIICEMLIKKEANTILIVLGLAFSELLFFRLADLCAQVFQSLDDLKATSLIFATSGLVKLITVILFYLFLDYANNLLLTWCLSYAISSAVFFAIVFILTVRRYGFPYIKLDGVKSETVEGIFYSLGVASTNAYTDVDKIILNSLSNSIIVGSYSTAYRLMTIAYTPIQAIVFSANTKFFRLGKEGFIPLVPTVRRIGIIAALYSVVAIFGIFLVSRFIVDIFGGEYLLSSTIIYYLSFLTIFQALNYLLGDAIMGTGNQRPRSLIQLSAAILCLVTNLWLVPLFSWKGSVLSAYISQIFLISGYLILIYKMVINEKVKIYA